ncbi:hypothetical protein, partial [Rhodohalobacter sulfatireducens]
GMYSKPYTPRQGILKKLDFYRGVLQKMMYGFLNRWNGGRTLERLKWEKSPKNGHKWVNYARRLR